MDNERRERLTKKRGYYERLREGRSTESGKMIAVYEEGGSATNGEKGHVKKRGLREVRAAKQGE
jgi:uncharacterized protein YjcR